MFGFVKETLERLTGNAALWCGDGDDMLLLLDRHGRILRASDSAERLTGQGPSALKGIALAALVPPSHRQAVLACLDQACTQNRSARTEILLKGSNADTTPVEITAAPAGKDRVRAVLRDISAQFAAREEASAELAGARREAESRTSYFADLSHEIRTPLNAIIGFADMMRAETFGPLGHEKYGEYAGLIHQSGEHLHALVSDLLDLSKIDADRYQLDEQPVMLASLAEGCVAMSRLQAEKAGLWLKQDFQDMPFPVLADARAVRQMLLNLLSNATKFTQEGGIKVRLRHDDNNVWLTVSDTGIGMSAEQVAEAGERFSKAHREGVRGTRGSGLGLALTTALAELHGGELRLSSQPGQGTTAAIRLPLKKTDIHPFPLSGPTDVAGTFPPQARAS